MKKIIFDCDNTFGIPGCDVDDGLALLYLLGHPKAELLGITCTYGNNQEHVVYENTKRMLKELGRAEIPLKRGGSCAGQLESESADFLVRMAREHRGELSVLATGSLTNLLGAYQADSGFFDNVKEIVLMGGITEPLVFQKKIMDELNFSCDPKAAYHVLTKGNNVSIITGNNCLKVLFTKSDYEKGLYQRESFVVQYIKAETDYWFDYNKAEYGIDGFYNWDVIAAVYLMEPGCFRARNYEMDIQEEELNCGYLRKAESSEKNCRLCIPVIDKAHYLQQHIYQTWQEVTVL